MQVPEHPKLRRLSFRKIAEDLLEIVNLEKGIPHTIKRLLTDPGAAIQEYLFEDRSRLAKPFGLLVLLVAIAAYISFRYLPLDSEMLDLIRQSPEAAKLPPLLLRTAEIYLSAVRQYFNLVYMSTIPFQAGATYLLYRNSRLNYMEHLVVNVYVFCIQTMVFILSTPFILQGPAFAVLQVVLTYGYLLYALKKIFGGSWPETVAKVIAMQLILQFAQVFVLLAVLLWVLVSG